MHGGTFAISPFANAVCLATAKPKPATAIATDETSYSLAPEGTDTVTVTPTPADSTTEFTFTSSDEDVFEVEQLTNLTATITGVDDGTATLTIKGDNGLTKSVTVTVATPDDNT